MPHFIMEKKPEHLKKNFCFRWLTHQLILNVWPEEDNTTHYP